MDVSPKTILLTGATGFLGRYFLKDLLLLGKQVIVIGRGRGPISGQDRIEAILQDWESRLGRRLLRPRFIDGNLNSPDLGIAGSKSENALLGSVDAVLHCAASLRFEEDEERQEPLRTNVTGTRNIVEFAQEWGIQHFHHISTAYVCGQRHCLIEESDLDQGQAFHNIYEQSKFQAEQVVRAAGGFTTKTIYRPSIVVGDSETGFSSTFHTIYSILRFLRALPEQNSASLDWIFHKLQLSGDEGKNLVPVDWVSQSTIALLDSPRAWGKTYHLTNSIPVTANQLSDAIAEAIAMKQHHWDAMALPASITDAQAAYQMHVDAYRGYLANDPQFDTSQFKNILPDNLAPAIDHAMLVKMLAFAIENRFRDPTLPIPRFIDGRDFVSSLDRAVHDDSVLESFKTFDWTIRISGFGGGIWNFGDSLGNEKKNANSWVHVTSETWTELLTGTLSAEQAIHAHRLLIIGSNEDRSLIRQRLEQLIAWCRVNLHHAENGDEGEEPSVLPLHKKKGGRRFA